MYHSFMAQNWAGLAIAFAVLAFGRWLYLRKRKSVRVLGYTVIALGGLMMIGAVIQVGSTITFSINNPPPGKMVDVGGFDMHVWAEGENNGKPSIVWMPGGHGAGIGLYHLHKVFREETRSILVDRPTTGWSQNGPFPRSTSAEVESVHLALEAAGESGPFVFVGHSYGGMLSAVYAARYPDEVDGIVLLEAGDAFIPMHAAYDMYSGIVTYSEVRAFAAQFSVETALDNLMFALIPDGEAKEAGMSALEKIGSALEDVLPQFKAVENHPRALISLASVLEEDYRVYNFFPLLVMDHELGDMPLTVVMQDFGAVMDKLRETQPEYLEAQYQRFHNATGLGREQFERYDQFMFNTPRRYLKVSSDSKLVIAPLGVTHNFPYETPHVVIEAVHDVLSRIAEKP